MGFIVLIVLYFIEELFVFECDVVMFDEFDFLFVVFVEDVWVMLGNSGGLVISCYVDIVLILFFY